MSTLSPETPKRKHRGPLAWMAKNSVAANILMLVLVAGGLVKMCSIKQEVFPEFELDLILVQGFHERDAPSELGKHFFEIAGAECPSAFSTAAAALDCGG